MPATRRLFDIDPEVEIWSAALTHSPNTDGGDLHELRAVLRDSLGTAKSESPTVDARWRESWRVLANIGIAGFCAAEDLGGFGLRVDAAVTAAIELGAALHGSPFAGLTASAHALSAAGNGDASVVAAAIASGEKICAWGWLDPSGSRSRTVDGGDDADALLLVEPVSGGMLLLDDRSLWSIDGPQDSFDGSRRCHDVTLDPAAGHRLASDPVAVSLHGLLLAADALGGLQRMLDRTVDYARERQAFGKAIGGFQAVQHRLVDHAVRIRGMSLAITAAAQQLGSGATGATLAVALAQVSVSSSATTILHDLLQLTGGIGFTWEYGLHLYERRAHHDARLAANPRAAIRTVAQCQGWINGG